MNHKKYVIRLKNSLEWKKCSVKEKREKWNRFWGFTYSRAKSALHDAASIHTSFYSKSSFSALNNSLKCNQNPRWNRKIPPFQRISSRGSAGKFISFLSSRFVEFSSLFTEPARYLPCGLFLFWSHLSHGSSIQSLRVYSMEQKGFEDSLLRFFFSLRCFSNPLLAIIRAWQFTDHRISQNSTSFLFMEFSREEIKKSDFLWMKKYPAFHFSIEIFRLDIRAFVIRKLLMIFNLSVK